MTVNLNKVNCYFSLAVRQYHSVVSGDIYIYIDNAHFSASNPTMSPLMVSSHVHCILLITDSVSAPAVSKSHCIRSQLTCV